MRDEVDDLPDAVHVAFLSGFNLRIYGCDDLVFCVLALGEVFEDAEAIHDAAGLEFDGADVVPFLQFLDRVSALEGSSGGCGGGVDVDMGPSFGGFAYLFEGSGYGGGVCGERFEGGRFSVFVFGIFWGDGSDEAEAEFELRVEEIQCIFLGRLVRRYFFILWTGRHTRMSHSLDSSFKFRSMTSSALAYR